MACYYPLDAWRAKAPNDNGRYPIVFSRSAAQQDEPLKLPCGKCIGCRLENSRQWAMRCTHEASLYEDNCFITLTYNDDHLPSNQSLVKKHWQDFAKRLRKKLEPHKIRFFMCGEYGDKLGRPHYHAIIFNYDFPDKKLLSMENDISLYESPILEKIWGKGLCSIGDVTFESAGYVARYCTKKINGEPAEDHYKKIDLITGEIVSVIPEFATQSNKPGIAADWVEKYKKDLDKGFITLRGVKMQPPKYYDKLYEKMDEYNYEFLKEKRALQIDPMDEELTPNRLDVKLKLKLKQIKQLNRKLDNVN